MSPSAAASRSVCFGGEGGDSACKYFRAAIPAKALAPFGWETSVAEYVLTPQTPEGLREYGPRIRGWKGPGTEVCEPADIVTLRIMDDVVIDPATKKGADNYRMDNMAGEIRRARDDGQIILYDIDDDLWHLPVWSPAARAMNKIIPYARACDLEVIDANIKACDGVITSTRYLADELHQRFPAVPVYVLPPGIDPEPYDTLDPPPSEHHLQVGWMGSISHHLQHLRSMQVALDCLPDLGAEFTRLGSIPGDQGQFLLSEVPCKVNQLPWGGISELPAKLAGIDIGIIPRVDEPFMEGQSITSGLQYAAAGVPFIASATQEYVELEKLGVGTTASTIAQWREWLMGFLCDGHERRREAKFARKIALDNYGLEATGRRYHEVLSSLLA